MYRGLNLGLEMSTTDWLELAETRRQSAYERSRPPLRMPVSCRRGSLDVFFAHDKRSHASRVLEYVSIRMVHTHVLPPVRQTHLSNIKCDYPGSVFRKPASGPGASRQKIESRSTSVIMMVASEQFIILEQYACMEEFFTPCLDSCSAIRGLIAPALAHHISIFSSWKDGYLKLS